MKKLFITLATVFVYLLISIPTGLWFITWIIWVFYAVYMIAEVFREHNKDD